MSIDLNYEEKIAILDLGDDENRFSPKFLEEINSCLDEVVGGEAHGLVTTGGGKFYSNGLDLEWLAAHGEQAQWYVNQVQRMLARVLTPPAAVTAMTTGQRFGGADAVALQLGASSLHHLGGKLVHRRLNAAAGYRSADCPVRSDHHHCARRTRRRSPGAHHRGDTRRLAGSPDCCQLGQYVTHNPSSPSVAA